MRIQKKKQEKLPLVDSRTRFKLKLRYRKIPKRSALALIKKFDKTPNETLPNLATEYGYKDKASMRSSVNALRRKYHAEQRTA